MEQRNTGASAAQLHNEEGAEVCSRRKAVGQQPCHPIRQQCRRGPDDTDDIRHGGEAFSAERSEGPVFTASWTGISGRLRRSRQAIHGSVRAGRRAAASARQRGILLSLLPIAGICILWRKMSWSPIPPGISALQQIMIHTKGAAIRGWRQPLKFSRSWDPFRCPRFQGD